ncbi:MAG: DNA mismatch repair protein MutS [Dehalococcoidia bacterium]|nr:DNA mismatch repair protein MutS [Dehalococcoidia bacterium]
MTTPLRRQYLEIKRRYPHAILFFRLGDFYETFDADAETAARELDITLTSRPVSKGQRVPLAGIPYHALDSYLAKLIAKGYKVAICEQMEAPGKGKGLVDRRVVRVVTPGTLVEDNLLTSGANNYLAALFPGDSRCGVAYVDVSTGEFACLQAAPEDAAAALERLRPAELLLPQGAAPPAGTAATLTPLPAGAFDQETAVAALLEHFGAASLEGLGLAGSAPAAIAAGAVVGYLRDNQRPVLGHVSRIALARPERTLFLDASTRRNLELFEPIRPAEAGAGGRPLTLLAVLDQTQTAMGQRLLRRWLGEPLLDITEIGHRQDGVQLFFDSAVRRGRTAALLAKMPDLERLCARVSTAAAGVLAATTPRDLAALRRGLELLAPLREALDGDGGSPGGKGGVREELLAGLAASGGSGEAAALMAAAVADDPQEGSVIRPGFSAELDRLRETARDARQYLADLERRERERSGIKSLRVGYNKVFGYYIEVSKANLGHVPDGYQRKQTLVGGERYTTPELAEHEYRVLHAQELQEELERTLLRQVCAQVAAAGARIRETAAAVALLDVYCGLGEAAARYGYVRPAVDEGGEIVVRDGRHPVVERMLPDASFVPNDLHLSADDSQVIVLSGPNLAGKSTYLRQAALIALMAQTGSFVPAAEARIGLVDRIFSRVGALDDIAAGRSTFMVEMLETAAILHGATPRSLLIFDEIGRGTSTYDGMAIARAVVEFIHNRPDARARTLFATHYHELTELASVLPRVRNFNVAVAEEGGRVVFLHRILPGGADRSYGVHVAQLAGLPKPVVLRAREILEELEARGEGRPAGRRSEGAPQLPLFSADGELRRELAALDPESLTPLQALTRLYELVERARGSPGP